jgi:hypothetical protein
MLFTSRSTGSKAVVWFKPAQTMYCSRCRYLWEKRKVILGPLDTIQWRGIKTDGGGDLSHLKLVAGSFPSSLWHWACLYSLWATFRCTHKWTKTETFLSGKCWQINKLNARRRNQHCPPCSYSKHMKLSIHHNKYCKEKEPWVLRI